jgi:large subunit ribosomal protein L21
MYAIVEIAGQQFKVEEGKTIFVHRLEAEKETILEFDRVLLAGDNEKVIVGEPLIENFVVEGRVIDHLRGDKVIVFKKKRKKGYRVKNGHRQNFSQIEITGIGEKGSIVHKDTPKKVKVKKVPEQSEEPATKELSAEEKKITAKKAGSKKNEPLIKEKKSAVKKVTEKKPAEKKTSKKKE